MSELPRINTTENVLNVLSSPQGTGIACMLCTANWGPIDDVLTISNLSDYKKNYGTSVTGVTGYKGARAFFNNGGVLKVLRIAHTGYAKSLKLFKDSSVVDAITITAKYHGTYGDLLTVTIIANGSNVDVYLSDGVNTEVYYNLDTNTTVVAAINTGDFATAVVETGTPDLVAPITTTYLTGGDNGTTSLEDADYITGFDTYLTDIAYRYLIIPGETENAFQITMAGKLDTRVTNEELYSRYLTGITLDESITTIKARTLGGRRATLCAPSLILDDIDNDGSYLACALAGKLCQLGIGNAGTNKPVVAEVDTVYTKPQQSELLDNSVTVIALVNNELRCLKDMTRHSDLTSPYKLGVISDEIDYAREAYETYLRNQLGQPNTAINRVGISSNLDLISSTLISDGIIESANQSTVVIGASADTIGATISILPIYSIDYIDLTINIK